MHREGAPATCTSTIVWNCIRRDKPYSYATHPHQIRSEVETTETTSQWGTSDMDWLDEFYTGEGLEVIRAEKRNDLRRSAEPAAKRRFVYNSQTKKFDEIIEE